MNFPDYVGFTLDRLENKGYTAFLVGGCVRDFIMGITPHDFDITTNAKPDEIEECFADVKTLDIGKKHGTVTLVFDKECVEVTTYRIDGEYKDSRHPESVTFTDRIENDLARRDFTMNAIAYSPKRGFVDPFGGRKDISRKRIVCVGNADERFTEDALRILRGLRFSSRLGFRIDEDTERGMLAKKELLLKIAGERVREEFNGILAGRFLCNVISDYNCSMEILSVIIPELENTDWGHLRDALMMAYEFDETVRLCAFMHNFDACDADRILHRLRFDNKTIKTVVSVVSNITQPWNATDLLSLKKCISELSENTAYYLYMTISCIFKWCNPDMGKKYREAAEKVRWLVKSGECLFVSQLDIKGNEIIMELGINPSDTGKILHCLLNDVLEETVINEKQALLKRAKQYVGKF